MQFIKLSSSISIAEAACCLSSIRPVCLGSNQDGDIYVQGVLIHADRRTTEGNDEILIQNEIMHRLARALESEIDIGVLPAQEVRREDGTINPWRTRIQVADLAKFLSGKEASFFSIDLLLEHPSFREAWDYHQGRTQAPLEEKPLHPRERKSVGQIIAVLASMAELDISKPYAAAEAMEAAAASSGLTMPHSSDTTVKFLKMASDKPAGK